MNTSNNKEAFELSPEELAQLGNGALSYIREIEGREVIRLVGPQARVAPDAKFSACSTPTVRRFQFREPAKPQPTAPLSMNFWQSACIKGYQAFHFYDGRVRHGHFFMRVDYGLGRRGGG